MLGLFSLSPTAVSGLTEFVRWSNLLAGIDREPTAAELGAHQGMIAVHTLRVENFLMFLKHVQNGATLRAESQLVESPRFTMRGKLDWMITASRDELWPPDRLCHSLQQLRPFTDGNGRIIRALRLRSEVRHGAKAYGGAFAVY